MITKTKPRQQGVLKDRSNFNESVKLWTSFYRANIHRFAMDYLGVSLKPFQMIILFMMNVNVIGAVIASRGIGKSWLTALFCCCKAILYPKSLIVIASGTF